MAHFPDMGEATQIAEGPHVRAVGWLSSSHEFDRGTVPAELVERLREFAARWGKSTESMWWPAAGGGHECELCDDAWAGGNFAVPSDGLLYVCPEMIHHYVVAHAYLPPEPFLRALAAAPLPGTQEYTAAVARFATPRPARA